MNLTDRSETRSAKIFTEGGPGKGLGHISRCAALASALKNAAWDVQVYLDAPGFALEFFPETHGTILNWTALPRLPHDLVQPASLCVFDSYHIDWELIEAYSRQFGAVPLCFDDNARLEYRRGVVVNGAANAATLYLSGPFPTAYLTGLKYQVLRPEFWTCPARVDFGPVARVLLCMGGDDLRGLMPSIYQLIKGAYPSVRIDCIASSVSGSNTELLGLVRRPDELHIDVDDKQTRELMYAADFAICGAGQMMYELAVCGLPAAFVQVAENQATNVASWERLGFGCGFLKWDSSDLLKDILAIVQSLSDSGLRRSQSLIGQSLIDGQGALRVVHEVSNLVSGMEGK